MVVFGVLLAACSTTSKGYWRHTQSSDVVEALRDGSEVLLITSDRAIHLADARVKDGFVSGQAEHVWRVPAGTKISTTDYESAPVDLAIRKQWLELADAPGPVEVSTIRFARILNISGGGKTAALTAVVILGVIGLLVLFAAACPEEARRPGNFGC